MSDFSSITDAELLEHAEHGFEYLGELDAEIGSEVAMFGDSWPGSARSYGEGRYELLAVENEIHRRGLRAPNPIPAANHHAGEVLYHAGYPTGALYPEDYQRPVALADKLRTKVVENDIPF
jgi:hypothetical protein